MRYVALAGTRRTFQPTLPARGATPSIKAGTPDTILFQPTLPARGATGADGRPIRHDGISTHAPRTGSDDFDTIFTVMMDISTHAPRTGSDHLLRPDGQSHQISTHAPRTGSDAPINPGRRFATYFNPRSPHGERRGGDASWPQSSPSFQPTLPARGATSTVRTLTSTSTHFNPRSPHGERHKVTRSNPATELISTHAPRTGSDRRRQLPPHIRVHISTHAPRTGSDCRRIPAPTRRRYFNPRSPHGERPPKTSGGFEERQFQPTLPARGATFRFVTFHQHKRISTHAPRTGSDVHAHRGAGRRGGISTHAPRTGSDASDSSVHG